MNNDLDLARAALRGLQSNPGHDRALAAKLALALLEAVAVQPKAGADMNRARLDPEPPPDSEYEAPGDLDANRASGAVFSVDGFSLRR